VMLTGGGNPVLVDFGLASLRDASRGPLSTVLFGTPAYLAPEQARAGKMGHDLRSDVYQLGVMLYELVTLERPWSEEPDDEVVAAIARKELPRAGAVEPRTAFELDCVCARAMTRRIDDRYQTATELRVDLERFLGRKVLPEAAQASAPLGLRCCYFLRRRALLLAAAAVAIAFAAVVMSRLW